MSKASIKASIKASHKQYWPKPFIPRKIYMKQNTKTCRRQRHSVSLLHAHLIFSIKYRRRVITPRAFDILKRSMRRTAQALGVDLIAIRSDGDHLHLMILYPPGLARLWGRHFWSAICLVVSCGGAPLDVIKACAENQTHPSRTGHGKNTLNWKNRRPYPLTEVRGLRARI